MFEDATFETTGRIRTRSRRWMIATFALNGSVLTVLILIPLIYPEALPRRFMSVLLTAPPPPAPPTVLRQEPTRAFRGAREYPDLGLSVPTRIPTTIARTSDRDGPPDDRPISIDPGGSGIPGGDDPFHGSSRPVVRLEPLPSGPAHISSVLAAGLLVQKVLPVYPPIARAAHVEGTVVLAAMISRYGAIENLRVVSGPPMLQQSALDAVEQWRYRPYKLNGEPVAVETTINVIFSFGH